MKPIFLGKEKIVEIIIDIIMVLERQLSEITFDRYIPILSVSSDRSVRATT